MSIKHLQDLSNSAFFEAIDSLNNYTITEKLDGAAIIMGVDNDGRFYTSREGKSGNRYYFSGAYPRNAAGACFANAHEFLSATDPTSYIATGDAYECEVLFGRQPNAIVYGSNKVAIIRPLIGDGGSLSAPIENFSSLLIGDNRTACHSIQYNVVNERNIEQTSHLTYWSLKAVPAVDSELFSRVVSQQAIQEFAEWLTTTSMVEDMTHEQLCNVKLTSIPKADRAVVRQLRTTTQDAAATHKRLIVEPLLVVLDGITSGLCDCELQPGEDIGIEGVVCLDQETGEQFKIVNKSKFTTINCFNHMVRNFVRKSSHAKMPADADVHGNTDDFTAFSVPNGVYDSFLSNISKMHGIAGLEWNMGITRTLRKYTGDTVEDTVSSLVSVWNERERSTNSEVRHITESRTTVITLCELALIHLDQVHTDYMDQGPGYRLGLGGDRWIGYSPAVHARTLMTIAEMREELTRIATEVRFVHSRADLLSVIFKKQLISIH